MLLSSKPQGTHHCLASAEPSSPPGTPFHAVEARRPGNTSSQSYFGFVFDASLMYSLRSAVQPADLGRAELAAGHAVPRGRGAQAWQHVVPVVLRVRL